MRVLFATQSDSLRLFEALRADLDRKAGVEAAGFTVADSFVYDQWLKDNPDFENQGHHLLKEWEVTARRDGAPDRAFLARKEEEIGGAAGLFGAIVADRRLFMGPDCTVTQDYRRRFTDDQLLCILQAGIEDVERLFDALKPDLVVGFICVTMLDYLVYLVARARGIRFMNIRPTRIGDRVTVSSTLNDPDPEFVAAFEEALEKGSPWQNEARAFLARVREKHGRYEGAVKPSDKPALTLNRQKSRPWQVLMRVARSAHRYWTTEARTDNHVPNPLRSLIFNAFINRWRARRASRQLRPVTVDPARLPEHFIFFPLHTEPEVSLLVYGRPYVNQIEILRALAMNMPAHMTLVVKEHPWMVGKRSRGAYRKLMDIPRLKFAPPQLDVRDLIPRADLVSVVTGSAALEAVILGKPVITFGDCPYNALPDRFVQRCKDPRHLAAQIKEMLAVPVETRDDATLEAYVAGAYATSKSINLYSDLLNKANVHVERAGSFAQEVSKLSDLIVERFAIPCDGVAPKSKDVARW